MRFTKKRHDSNEGNPTLAGSDFELMKSSHIETDRELPPVNASKPTSKSKKAVVIAVMGALAAFLVFQMSNTEDRKAVAEKKRQEDEAKSNPIDGKLPVLTTPDRPPYPVMAQDQNGGSTSIDPATDQPGQVPATDQPGQVPATDQPGQVPATSQPGQVSATGQHGQAPVASSQPPTKANWELTRDRRRNGEIAVAFETRSNNAPASPAFDTKGDGRPIGVLGSGTREDSSNNTELSKQLNGTTTRAALAGKLFDRTYLIPKGAFLDCALETRIDSTVPGMTSCILTRNIYSDNGKLILLDRGSKIVGEYAGGLKQGQARIFVLWTRIQTPKGVIINLDSPGTDSLGASGHDGYVDTHFWARFGGAIMLSLIDDFAAYASKQDQNDTSTNINFGNTRGAATEMATEALKNSINIPPTLMKNHGEHINIYIARDLDFRSVYGIRISK